jgi:predicted nucleic-acid-binding Zn-ribbon protein
MQNGHCPKCSGQEVYFSDARGIQQGITEESYLNIFKDKKWVPDVALLKMAYYVCQTCGYFETYVAELDKLAKLTDATNWHKVGGGPGQ